MIADVFIGLIILIAILYAALPLWIYRVQKLPARVNFDAVDEEVFLSDQSDKFKLLDNKLKEIGFEYIGSSTLYDIHNTTCFSLYFNAKGNTTGMLVSMKSEADSFTYVEFSQLYSDETMLDVSNSLAVPVYPKMDVKISARFPKVQDVENLYRIFLQLKSSLKNSSSPIGYKREYGFSKIEAFIAKESDELVYLGYCKESIDLEGKRSLTLKGAFIFTWKNIFPGKGIYDKLDQAYSQKLLINS
ncbi:hypothetical protein MNBD_GAMMA17-197 [hydrothermal vent metagenome]|uniref:Uncharacterized protein n=1 Tax=hydrothermal vent metagenome TaxID=652676 RepID=A0A3B0ZQX8_9ZZZZ